MAGVVNNRATPGRRKAGGGPTFRSRCAPESKKPPAAGPRAASEIDRHEEESVLGRPGSDLLFQVLRLSTIGAGEFDGRVRDGIGYRLPANTTRPAKDEIGR